jgi:hypothetical protein
MPHIRVQPSWHGVMVAGSDDADWKTKNNLAIPRRVGCIVFPARELFAEVAMSPCTVGKWVVSIISSTCC